MACSECFSLTKAQEDIGHLSNLSVEVAMFCLLSVFNTHKQDRLFTSAEPTHTCVINIITVFHTILLLPQYQGAEFVSNYKAGYC